MRGRKPSLRPPWRCRRRADTPLARDNQVVLISIRPPDAQGQSGGKSPPLWRVDAFKNPAASYAPEKKTLRGFQPVGTKAILPRGGDSGQFGVAVRHQDERLARPVRPRDETINPTHRPVRLALRRADAPQPRRRPSQRPQHAENGKHSQQLKESESCPAPTIRARTHLPARRPPRSPCRVLHINGPPKRKGGKSKNQLLPPHHSVSWQRPTLPCVPHTVPSALAGLTSGFGMGPGVPPPLFPPENISLPCINQHPKQNAIMIQRTKFRRISTGQLNASQRLHLRPIHPLVWRTS